MVESLVRLVEASRCGPTSLNQDDEEEQGAFAQLELEQNDPYCKLAQAQHSDTLAVEIVNFKAYLAQAVMVRATTLKPDSASCITEEIRRYLASYAQQV
ncbi:unnamed protein product [Gongylonema pulchrum]|uniref:Uncharacterized protein n=1 Tax=Gongylonema pulchrum TaxID=637853 RepID=A0A3P6QPD0_9BILA|nr:unnamed protein product [Gongylonema pulchrum]